MPASEKCLLTLATCATVIPFCMSSNNLSDATSRPPLTAIHPDAFNK